MLLDQLIAQLDDVGLYFFPCKDVKIWLSNKLRMGMRRSLERGLIDVGNDRTHTRMPVFVCGKRADYWIILRCKLYTSQVSLTPRSYLSLQDKRMNFQGG